MIKTIIILLLLTLNSTTAQVSQEWVAKYKDSTTGTVYPASVSTDNLGFIYVSGSCNVSSRSRYITFKYSTAGILQWYKIYQNSFLAEFGQDHVLKNAVDKDNNVYVTGYSYNDSNTDIVTIKYNSSGDSLWVKRYNGINDGFDFPRDLVIDKHSNVYITAITRGSNSDDYLTMKYDSSGNLIWTAVYPDGDVPNAMAIDSSGNVYITGESSSFYTTYMTIKYNNSGELQWARTHGSPRDAEGTSIAADREGNIYVTGFITLSNGGSNYSTLKYDSLGNLLWMENFDRFFSMNPYSIIVDSMSNCFIIGSSAIIKYNSFGSILWADTSNSIYAGVYSVLDNFGSLYITKITNINATSNYFTIQKYGTNGNIIWVSNYGGELNHIHEPHGITIDKDNNIVATGFEFLNGTKFSDTLITIKYSQTTGIINYNSYKSDYKLFQNYPNPFNPITKIRYQIGNNSYVRLKIFDIEGKDIKTLVKKYQNTGSYIVQFDGNDLSSGIYFYSLYINNELIETKKLMLLK